MVVPAWSPSAVALGVSTATRHSTGTGATVDKAARAGSHHGTAARCWRQAAVAAGVRLPAAAWSNGTYAQEVVADVTGPAGGPRSVQCASRTTLPAGASGSESVKGLKPKELHAAESSGPQAGSHGCLHKAQAGYER